MDGQNFDPSFGKLPSPVIEQPKAPEIKTQDFFPVKLKSGEVIKEPKRFTATGRKLIDADDEVKNAETEGAVQFASGVVRVSDAPQYQTPESTKLLYGETLGVTRYQALRTAVGLKDNESFTDYYKQNGFVPKGFELEAKLLLHEEKTKKLEASYRKGEIGYDTFLFKAYGKDLLKASGHDIESSLYWYNRRKQGLFDSPIDDVLQLKNLLAQAEQYYQNEVWAQESNSRRVDETFASLLVDEPLPVDKVRDLFPEAFAELDKYYESDEEKVRLYRAGMLSGLNPVVDTDGDGKIDYYYHTDGKLYRVADAGVAKGNEAKAYYNADGSLDRISVNELTGEIGDSFIKGLGTVFGSVFEIISGLGVGLYDTMENLFTGDWEYDKLADWYVGWQGWKNSTWMFSNNVFSTGSGFKNADGTIDVDGIARGVSSAAGTIVGMIATAGIGGKLSALGKGIKAADVLTAKGISAKIGTVAKLGISKTGSLMQTATGLANGVPIIPALGKTIQLQTIQGLTFLAVRDWTTSVASLTARKEELGLTDAEIIGQSSLMTGINFGVSYAMRSVLDKSALSRHSESIAAKIAAAEKISVLDVHTPFVDAVRGWVKHSPRTFMLANTIMDVAENLITMGTQTAVSQTGNILDAKSWASLWNPQVLATQLFVGYTTYKGGFGRLNEGLETQGILNNFGRLTTRADDFRSEIKMQLDRARTNNDVQLANKFASILSKFENDINFRIENGKQIPEKNAITGLTRAFYEMHKMLGTENESVVRNILMKAYDVQQTYDILAGIEFGFEYLKSSLTATNKVYKDIFANGDFLGDGVQAQIPDIKGKAARVFRQFATNLKQASGLNAMKAVESNELIRGFVYDTVKNSATGKEADELFKGVDSYLGYNFIETEDVKNQDGTPTGAKRYTLKDPINTNLSDSEATALIDLARRIGLNDQNIKNGMFFTIPGKGSDAESTERYKNLLLIMSNAAKLSTYGEDQNLRSLIYDLGNGKYFVPYYNEFGMPDSLAKIHAINKNIFALRFGSTPQVKLDALKGYLALKDVNIDTLIKDGKITNTESASALLKAIDELYQGGSKGAVLSKSQLADLVRSDIFKAILDLKSQIANVPASIENIIKYTKTIDVFNEVNDKFLKGKKVVDKDLKDDLTKIMETFSELEPAEQAAILNDLKIDRKVFDEIIQTYLKSNPIQSRLLLETILKDFLVSQDSLVDDPELKQKVTNKIVSLITDEATRPENLLYQYTKDGRASFKRIQESTLERDFYFKDYINDVLVKEGVDSIFDIDTDSFDKIYTYVRSKLIEEAPSVSPDNAFFNNKANQEAAKILSMISNERQKNFFKNTIYGSEGIQNITDDANGKKFVQMIFDAYKRVLPTLPEAFKIALSKYPEFKLEDFYNDNERFKQLFSSGKTTSKKLIASIAFLGSKLNLEPNRNVNLASRIENAVKVSERINLEGTVRTKGNNRVHLDIANFIGKYENILINAIRSSTLRNIPASFEPDNLNDFLKLINIPEPEAFIKKLQGEHLLKDQLLRRYPTGVVSFDSLSNKTFLDLLEKANYESFDIKDMNTVIPGVYFKDNAEHNAVPIKFNNLELKKAFDLFLKQESQKREVAIETLKKQIEKKNVNFVSLIESSVGSYFNITSDTKILEGIKDPSKFNMLLSDLGDLDEADLTDVGRIVASEIGKIKTGRTASAVVLGLFFELTQGAGIKAKADPALRANKYYIEAIRLLGDYQNSKNKASSKPVLLERKLDDNQVKIIQDAGIWDVQKKTDAAPSFVEGQSLPTYILSLKENAKANGLAYLANNKVINPLAVLPLLTGMEAVFYEDGSNVLASNTRGLASTDTKIQGQTAVSYVVNNFKLLSEVDFNTFFSKPIELGYSGHNLESKVVELLRGKTVDYVLNGVLIDPSIANETKEMLKSNIYYQMLKKSLEGSLKVSQLVSNEINAGQENQSLIKMFNILGDSNVRQIIGYGLNQGIDLKEIANDVNAYLKKPKSPNIPDYKDTQVSRLGVNKNETYLAGEDVLRLNFIPEVKNITITAEDIGQLKDYVSDNVFTNFHFNDMADVDLKKNLGAVLYSLFDQDTTKNIDTLNLFVDDLIALNDLEFKYLIDNLKGKVSDSTINLLVEKYNLAQQNYNETIESNFQKIKLGGAGLDEPTFEMVDLFIRSKNDPNYKTAQIARKNALSLNKGGFVKDLFVKASQAEPGLIKHKDGNYLSRLRNVFLEHDKTNNTMSRLIPNITLIRMLGDFTSSIEIAAKQLLSSNEFNMDKDQAINLATEMYFQSTGNDYSKEYGRYIIYDNKEGKLVNIVEQTGGNKKSVNEITFDVMKNYLNKDTKDYIVFDLERNMFHNGSLGLNNKLKFMKLDDNNKEFLKNLFYKNTWDQFKIESKTDLPTSPEAMLQAIKQVHATSVTNAYIKSRAIERFKDVPNGERLINKVFLKMSSYLAGRSEREIAFINTVLLGGQYSNELKEKYNIREAIVNDILKYMVHWDELNYDIKTEIENSKNAYLNKFLDSEFGSFFKEGKAVGKNFLKNLNELILNNDTKKLNEKLNSIMPRLNAQPELKEKLFDFLINYNILSDKKGKSLNFILNDSNIDIIKKNRAVGTLINFKTFDRTNNEVSIDAGDVFKKTFSSLDVESMYDSKKSFVFQVVLKQYNGIDNYKDFVTNKLKPEVQKEKVVYVPVFVEYQGKEYLLDNNFINSFFGGNKALAIETLFPAYYNDYYNNNNRSGSKVAFDKYLEEINTPTYKNFTKDKLKGYLDQAFVAFENDGPVITYNGKNFDLGQLEKNSKGYLNVKSEGLLLKEGLLSATSFLLRNQIDIFNDIVKKVPTNFSNKITSTQSLSLDNLSEFFNLKEMYQGTHDATVDTDLAVQIGVRFLSLAESINQKQTDILNDIEKIAKVYYQNELKDLTPEATKEFIDNKVNRMSFEKLNQDDLTAFSKKYIDDYKKIFDLKDGQISKLSKDIEETFKDLNYIFLKTEYDVQKKKLKEYVESLADFNKDYIYKLQSGAAKNVASILEYLMVKGLGINLDEIKFETFNLRNYDKESFVSRLRNTLKDVFGVEVLGEDGFYDSFSKNRIRDFLTMSSEDIFAKLSTSGKYGKTISLDDFNASKISYDGSRMIDFFNKLSKSEAGKELRNEVSQISFEYKLANKLNPLINEVFNYDFLNLKDQNNNSLISMLYDEMATFHARDINMTDEKFAQRVASAKEIVESAGVQEAKELLKNRNAIDIKFDSMYLLASAVNPENKYDIVPLTLNELGKQKIAVNEIGIREDVLLELTGLPDLQAVKTNYGTEIFIPVIRHPGDHVGSITFYKVKVLANNSLVKTVLNPDVMKGIHFGDFDGDHLTIIRPDLNVQEFAKKMFDYTKKGYSMLDYILKDTEKFNYDSSNLDFLFKDQAMKDAIDRNLAKDLVDLYEIKNPVKQHEEYLTRRENLINVLKEQKGFKGLSDDAINEIVDVAWIKETNVSSAFTDKPYRYTTFNRFVDLKESGKARDINAQAFKDIALAKSLFKEQLYFVDRGMGEIQKRLDPAFLKNKRIKDIFFLNAFSITEYTAKLLNSNIDLAKTRALDFITKDKNSVLNKQAVDVVTKLIRESKTVEELVGAINVYEGYVFNSSQFETTAKEALESLDKFNLDKLGSAKDYYKALELFAKSRGVKDPVEKLVNKGLKSGSDVLDSFVGHFNLMDSMLADNVNPEFYIGGYKNNTLTNKYFDQKITEAVNKDTKYFNNLDLRTGDKEEEGYSNWVTATVLLDLNNTFNTAEDTMLITKNGSQNLYLEKAGSILIKEDTVGTNIDFSKPFLVKEPTEVFKGIVLDAGTWVNGIVENESGEMRLLVSKRKNIDGTSKLAFVGGKTGKGTLVGEAPETVNEIGGQKIDLVYNAMNFDFSKVGPVLAKQMGEIQYFDSKNNPTTKANKNVAYAVVKMPVGVVEDPDFWRGGVKESILDETTIANNSRSLEGAILMGSQFVVRNNDGSLTFDNRIVTEAQNFWKRYNSPLATERNAMRLHHTLMYSVLLDKIKDLSKQKKAELMQRFMHNTMTASKKGLSEIQKMYTDYFKKKGIKLEDLNLSDIEKYILSEDLYNKFLNLQPVKVLEPAKTLKSKSSMQKDVPLSYKHIDAGVGVEGKVAAFVDTKTNNVTVNDNSNGHMGQQKYINFIITLYNKINETNNKRIQHLSKTDLDAGLVRGVYNFDKGFEGSQSNNFNFISAEDATMLGLIKGNYVNDSAKTGTPSYQPVLDVPTTSYDLTGLPLDSLFDYNSRFKDNNAKTPTTNWGVRKFGGQIFGKYFDIKQDKDGKVQIVRKDFKEVTPTGYKTFLNELMNGFSKEKTAIGRAALYGWTPDSYVLNVEPKSFVYGNDGNYHIEFNQDNVGKVINNPDNLEKEMKDIFKTYKYFDFVDKKEESEIENNQALRQSIIKEALASVETSKNSFNKLITSIEKEIEDGAFRLFDEKISASYGTDLYLETFGEKVFQKLDESAKRSIIEFNKGDEQSLHKMFQVDLLESSGIKITDNLSVKASELLMRIERDKYVMTLGLSKSYLDLYQEVNNRGLLKETNEYASNKALISIIEHLEKTKAKATSGVEITKINTEIEAHLKSANKTLEQAKAFVTFFENNRGDIAYKMYKHNSTIVDEARTISALNEEVSDDIFWLLTPTVKKQDTKTKNAFIRQALFSYSRPDANKIPEMYMNYNYFESMTNMIKQVVNSNRYRSFAERAKMEGFMENSTPHNFIVEEVIKTFEPLLEEIKSSNDMEDYNLLQSMIKNNIPISQGNFGEGNSKKFGGTAGQKYFALFNELREFTSSHKKSYSQAVADLRMNPTDPESAELNKSIIKAYDYQNDIIASLIIKGSKKNKDIAENIFNAMKANAEANGLALVDRFGRMFRNDFKDFRTLGSYSTEYVKSLFKYFTTYNGGFEANVLLDAINGDVFYMNKSLAEHADKNFFTEKVPGPVLKTFKKVSSLATQLIMSSPLKLVDRFLMFTGFDLATLSLANPKTSLKLPEAANMLSEFLQSNGASMKPEIRDYFIGRGVDITKQTTDAIFNNTQDGIKIGGPLKPWFDVVSKTLSTQHELGRFAFYLATLEDIKKNGGIAKHWGAAYSDKEALRDAFTDIKDNKGNVISKESQQALFIMGRQIGAINDFPLLAKKLSGYLMFTTFPLAHLRWARGELKSFATATKEFLFEGDKRGEAFRHLAVQGLGAMGIYLTMNFLLSLWGNQLNLEEEEIKELQDRQAVPEVFKTLMVGKPIFNTWNTTNPFALMYDMTARPIVDAAVQEDKSVLDGIFSLVTSNLASRGNPIVKSVAEILGGVDVIGGSINDTSDRYGLWENVFRKSTGYIVGASGANSLTNYLFKDAPRQNQSFVETFDQSVKLIIAAELGNSRAFKSSLKNYYKANGIVNTYRFAESTQDQNELSKLNLSGFNKEGYDNLRKDISAALKRKAKPSVIYGLIQDAMDNGLSIKEVRSAVNNNTIRYKLEQIKDFNGFVNNLNESEMQSIKDALAYESNLFPWLDELRDYIDDAYKKQNTYRPYTPRPQFRRFNAQMPRTYFNNQQRFNGNNYRLPYLQAQDPFKAYRQSWFRLNPPKEEDED